MGSGNGMGKRRRGKGTAWARGGRQAGGAAIEYVIVSTFATLLAVAAVAFVGKALKGKIQAMEDKLGVTFDGGVLDLF